MSTKRDLEEEIVKAIKTCYDPEIPVDVYELGLIYGIDIDDKHNVLTKMTLTTPACPVAGLSRQSARCRASSRLRFR